MALVVYPFLFLKFYLLDAPVAFIKYSLELTQYTARLVSFPLLIKTFFKPLKNEYRKDLILFSVVMGMAVKLLLIVADLAIILLCLFLEVTIFVAIYLVPLYLLYKLI